MRVTIIILLIISITNLSLVTSKHSQLYINYKDNNVILIPTIKSKNNLLIGGGKFENYNNYIDISVTSNTKQKILYPNFKYKYFRLYVKYSVLSRSSMTDYYFGIFDSSFHYILATGERWNWESGSKTVDTLVAYNGVKLRGVYPLQNVGDIVEIILEYTPDSHYRIFVNGELVYDKVLTPYKQYKYIGALLDLDGDDKMRIYKLIITSLSTQKVLWIPF